MNKHIKISVLTFLALMLFIAETGSTLPVSNDKVKGKVVYSDDLQPVSGGKIEIVTVKTGALGRVVLEKAEIQPDGTFIISKNFLDVADEIKIMAYPNDVDGAASGFMKSEFATKDVLTKGENGDINILLKVERITVNTK